MTTAIAVATAVAFVAVLIVDLRSARAWPPLAVGIGFAAVLVLAALLAAATSWGGESASGGEITNSVALLLAAVFVFAASMAGVVASRTVWLLRRLGGARRR